MPQKQSLKWKKGVVQPNMNGIALVLETTASSHSMNLSWHFQLSPGCLWVSSLDFLFMSENIVPRLVCLRAAENNYILHLQHPRKHKDWFVSLHSSALINNPWRSQGEALWAVQGVGVCVSGPHALVKSFLSLSLLLVVMIWGRYQYSHFACENWYLKMLKHFMNEVIGLKQWCQKLNYICKISILNFFS